MAKGRNFLKVTGILMIIGAALGIILGIIALIGAIAILSGAAADLVTIEEGAALANVSSLVVVSAVVGLIGAVIQLIAGILGVKNSNRPEKATVCIVFGIIVLVLEIISLIMTFTSGGTASALTIISDIVLGVAIPILYLVGAFLNKKQANAQA